MTQPRLVPFREMKDVSGEFSFKEYENAIMHPDGMFLGFFAMIHLNKNHPQYTNVKLNPDPTAVNIYTTKGWQKCAMSDIIEQMKQENLQCLQYVRKNGPDMIRDFLAKNK